MRSHPEELLADYVDGGLEEAARAEVEAHVAGCERCREEIRLASEARGSLSGLPEVEPPFGLTHEVLREARRPARRFGPALWVGAGAAAVVAAAALFFMSSLGGQQELGEGGRSARPAAVPPREDAATPGAGSFVSGSEVAGYPVLRRSDRDYTPASLSRRARVLAAEAKESFDRGFPRTALAFYEQVSLERLEDPLASALACATSGAPPGRTVVPFVLEEARFQGIPAYVASLLQGPGAEIPFDQVQLLVVEREGCVVRHFAFQRL